jgi:hypothetical protein
MARCRLHCDTELPAQQVCSSERLNARSEPDGTSDLDIIGDQDPRLILRVIVGDSFVVGRGILLR